MSQRLLGVHWRNRDGLLVVCIPGETGPDIRIAERDVHHGEDLVDCNCLSTVAVAGAEWRCGSAAVHVTLSTCVGVALAVMLGAKPDVAALVGVGL